MTLLELASTIGAAALLLIFAVTFLGVLAAYYISELDRRMRERK
jgi:hypothetical protein